MFNKAKAIAFDLDPSSLRSLHEAFPEWEIGVMQGATDASFAKDWNLGAADLLIVGSHDDMAQTLGLCRNLRSVAGWADTPLLALVQPDQPELVRAALKAGANNCLLLPVNAKEIVHMVAHSHDGNRPGRHTLNLDNAQRKDPWRDNGGQG